jgi:hypothetical protein
MILVGLDDPQERRLDITVDLVANRLADLIRCCVVVGDELGSVNSVKRCAFERSLVYHIDSQLSDDLESSSLL